MRSGVLAEGCHQAAAVGGAGRQRDMAGLDTLKGNRSEVGAQAADGQIAAVSDDLVNAIVAHGDPDSIAATVGAHLAADASMRG